jgi:ParB family chromosome partitioning protein
VSEPTKKKRGLGKGIGSLMQDYSYDSVVEEVLHSTGEAAVQVLEVPIEKIRANPNQPRRSFNQEALAELAQSIKREGVLQPILVEEIGPGSYSIVAGERRYRASKLAGLETIPVLVKDFNQMQRLEVSLIENIQRENLNPIEEAKAFAYLIQEAGITQEELAQRVGKNRSTISNSIRLLQLNSSMQKDLLDGKFNAGQARAILSVVNPADREILYKMVLEKELSVRATEELAAKFNEGKRAMYQKKKRASKDLHKSVEVIAAEDKFLQAFGSQVEIKGNLNKGRLQIQFRSSEELERLYQLLAPNQELFERE